ncbi:MAG: hypothetical protein DWQ36_12785 [Acidobacteria bacterium]|nr:MAG: hypothetical protein DWQ36_12785 [Acidobacteriota bacterium]
MTSRILVALLASTIGLCASRVVGQTDFGPEIEILSQGSVNGVSAGDLDGAPGADVFAGAESPSTLYVAFQGAGGTWSDTELTPGSRSRAVELGDLDGDGDLDLVYSDFGGSLFWRSNDLDVSGTFLPRQELGMVGGAQGVFIVDLDGDGNGEGDLDVLLAGRIDDAYYWFENVGGDGSSWTQHLIQNGINAAQAIWGGDIDGDGLVDVVGGSASGSGKLAWYENRMDDAGPAWIEHDIALGSLNAVSGADLDKDGDLDILVQDSGLTEIRWWENRLGDDPAWVVHTIAMVSSAGRGLDAVDLDFDGDLDVVGSRDGEWYENVDGDALSWTAWPLSPGTAGDLADTDAEDVDGDGDVDIVAARVDLDKVSWWPNLSCSPGDPDDDDDGVFDGCDICEGFDDNEDEDGDGVPDGCDSCPIGDNNIDTDGDGVPDACDGLRVVNVAMDEGDTGTTPLTFRIILGGDTGPFTVGYTVTEGTATTPEDYHDTSGTIAFAGDDGEEHVFTVLGFGDTMVEDDETFTVDLTLESGSVDLVDPVGVGTLGNDDVATLGLDDVSHAEGDSGTHRFTFTLTLDKDVDDGFEVDYATQAITATQGSDYVGHAGSVFFAGDAFERHAVTVLVKGDTVAEDDEVFHLEVSSDHPGVVSDENGVGTILDDDTVYLLVDSPSVVEGNAGTVDLVFTLELTHDTEPFDVDYETIANSADGEDYEEIIDTVSFAGTAGETHTVAISVTGDLVVEGDETFSLHLSPTDPEIVASDATGTILDDDSAAVGIDDVTMVEGDTGTTDFVFTISLTAPVEDAFDVGFQTIDQSATAGSDYTATSGSVSLGGGSSSQTVTVVVHGDGFGESDEHFVVEVFATLPQGVTFTDELGYGHVLDDDVVLDLTVEGLGHVGSSPPGIDCGNGALDCDQLYPIDTVVGLTATPEPDWTFAGFRGDTDCDDGSVTMTGATACIATFVLDQGVIDVGFEGYGLGLVMSEPSGIACDRDGDPSDCTAVYDTGTEVSLSVTVTDPESTFVAWTGDADCLDGLVVLGTSGETVHCVAIINATPLFADGFESGDVTSWTSAVP